MESDSWYVKKAQATKCTNIYLYSSHLCFAGVASALLNFLRVAVLNRDTCNALAVHKGRVHESMLCVGGVAAGPGVCPNTQGGGLFCAQNNNQNMFVGVLTGGFGCGAANSPGIYTQVRILRLCFEH